MLNEPSTLDGPELCLVMQKIFWLTVQRDIRISAAWVPRAENAVADDISKWIDTTDVRLDPTVFASLSTRWGPYDYDLFASANTRQVEKYFSWFHTPTSMGVNAFANTWTGTCWAFPPFSLLGPFWRHVASLEELVITVVVPVWPTAPWWDYVQPECGPQFAPCVRSGLYHSAALSLPLAKLVLGRGKVPGTAVLLIGRFVLGPSAGPGLDPTSGRPAPLAMRRPTPLAHN